MKFIRKPIIIEATRWFKNGDHPLDGYNGEGKVVRYFRHPDISGTSVCNECMQPMQDHGWIDSLDDDCTVCPGDWIIKGARKDPYPCKPDIFNATYELYIN